MDKKQDILGALGAIGGTGGISVMEAPKDVVNYKIKDGAQSWKKRTKTC